MDVLLRIQFLTFRFYVFYRMGRWRHRLSWRMTKLLKHLAYLRQINRNARIIVWSMAHLWTRQLQATSTTKTLFRYSRNMTHGPRWFSIVSHTAKFKILKTRKMLDKLLNLEVQQGIKKRSLGLHLSPRIKSKRRRYILTEKLIRWSETELPWRKQQFVWKDWWWSMPSAERQLKTITI